MNKFYFLFVTVVITTGCNTVPDYPISGSYAKINEMQILDPMAPENNNGIVNDLEGNYGKKVIDGYKNSIYVSKEGRANTTAKGLGK